MVARKARRHQCFQKSHQIDMVAFHSGPCLVMVAVMLAVMVVMVAVMAVLVKAEHRRTQPGKMTFEELHIGRIGRENLYQCAKNLLLPILHPMNF